MAIAPCSNRDYTIESLEEIPQELHDNPFFTAHTDEYISFLPLRHPVRDKRHPQHVFEKKTIVAWLSKQPRSPVTGEPMTVSDLEPEVELQKQIDDKLHAFLSKKHNFHSLKIDYDRNTLPLFIAYLVKSIFSNLLKRH